MSKHEYLHELNNNIGYDFVFDLRLLYTILKFVKEKENSHAFKCLNTLLLRFKWENL